MTRYKEHWKSLIHRALQQVAGDRGMDGDQLPASSVVVEVPPKPELGDLAFPMFAFAKTFRAAPQQIAGAVSEVVSALPDAADATVDTAGPYVNISLNRADVTGEVLRSVLSDGANYGRTTSLDGQRIMIEFSNPNTNKPLHLGHMRNDALGESVSRILSANGANVQKVNIVNDRGVHICQSMLAYKKFGNGRTPESEGMKSDHFVGEYYVKFSNWAKEHPEAHEEARAMLRAWEQGDPEVMELWETMRRWVLDGFQETYDATGVSFDEVYFESKTYLLGKSEILKGLERGVFYREEDGSVWVDLEAINLDKKVLLRSDGTSLYMTQDVGTVIERRKDWPFDRMIYVVAVEQRYHFQVLFYVLSLLGFPWAEALYHLAYGMVNLPEGKMKSREGTVVDADDILKQLEDLAVEEIRTKEREEAVGDLRGTATAIALGAMHYFLLQVSAFKDMVFDPKKSISFNGDTGPYLQYMGARLSSMLRKYDASIEQYGGGTFLPELLQVDEEWELVKKIASLPEVVEKAGTEYNPSYLTEYLYDLGKVFSRYYHDNPVLHNEDRDLVESRLTLVRAVRQVLVNSLPLVCIPFLETM
jgi:arginyl-tRNA synthetase